MSFETDQNALRGMLTIPAWRVAWSYVRELYSAPFRAHVDHMLRVTPASTPFDLGRRFSAERLAEWERASAQVGGLQSD